MDLARPEIIKTDLGRRLRDVRRLLGDPDRESFAEKLGVSARSLATYERGDSEPNSGVLSAYKELHGININWLLSGDGEMFINAAKAPPSTKKVNPDLMRWLAKVAREVHKEAHIPPVGDAILSEATWLYNSLLKTVSDLSDMEEIIASLPKLRLSLKRQLQQQSMQQRVQENSR